MPSYSTKGSLTVGGSTSSTSGKTNKYSGKIGKEYALKSLYCAAENDEQGVRLEVGEADLLKRVIVGHPNLVKLVGNLEDGLTKRVLSKTYLELFGKLSGTIDLRQGQETNRESIFP